MGTREEILAAATRVMREQGYARATTKEIARVAGYSEATLYKHFADKAHLFRSVLSEQLPGLGKVLTELTERAGTGTVRANLTRVARLAIDFYTESFPVAASLFSTRELLTSHRQAMADHGAGPRNPHEGLVRYLKAEQRLGRLPRSADPEALSALLLGACFQQAFLTAFDDAEPSGKEREKLAKSLVKTLLQGLG
ncbi:TetR/AcrR family transcriptional regulator [Amycolatopsis rhizosphaerae]|uniref:TetR/AcrR family transcriptional regulator n=1 Tax=Amycolatopsis rhizosphaerae TaxID=2053003 RepID=A0A558CPB4_9PSEU|nr:TetR/AcrR family transcriptional regulator [Amycolatopsis rhizosphaerae]TVT50587.1 TetR/AcrR family transcriptional regulator [Amycolatopsis rhizosphaerae]